MKRQLTDEEKAVTKKRLVAHIDLVKQMKEAVAYSNAVKEFQKQERKFKDKWRDYERKLKDDADYLFIEAKEDEIKDKEDFIKQTQKQIKFGIVQPAQPNCVG